MGKLILLLKQNWFLVAVAVALLWLLSSLSKNGILGTIKNLVLGKGNAGTVPGSYHAEVIKQIGQISDTDSKRLANLLYYSMEGVGTDEETIEQVYNNLVGRPTATIQVYNAFGTPNYSVYGSPFWGLSGTPLNLKMWIQKELSGQRLKDWNNLFALAGII